MIDHGPNVIKETVWLVITNDDSIENKVEFDHYEPYVIIGPNPCSQSNGCKRVSTTMIECTSTPPPTEY